MTKKNVSAYLFLKNGRAASGFDGALLEGENRPAVLAQLYENSGADELIVFDLSKGDGEHEESLNQIREIARSVDFPIFWRRKHPAGGGCEKTALCRMPESLLKLFQKFQCGYG